MSSRLHPSWADVMTERRSCRCRQPAASCRRAEVREQDVSEWSPSVARCRMLWRQRRLVGAAAAAVPSRPGGRRPGQWRLPWRGTGDEDDAALTSQTRRLLLRVRSGRSPLLFAAVSELFGLRHYSTMCNLSAAASPVGSYALNVLVSGITAGRSLPARTAWRAWGCA